VKYTISVTHSLIDIKCDAEPYEDHLFSWIIGRASTLLRGLIDLYSFTTGVPLVVILDSLVTPEGEEKRLLPSNPHLVGISSLPASGGPYLKNVGLGNMLPIVVGDIRLMASLRDLVMAIGYAGTAAIDCARAIEGLRMIVQPDGDKKKGWHLLQCKLNLSEDYIKHVTKASEKPRHGNREHMPGEAIDEITKRSWMIMNRFLEFSSRGGLEPLPFSEFPLL